MLAWWFVGVAATEGNMCMQHIQLAECNAIRRPSLVITVNSAHSFPFGPFLLPTSESKFADWLIWKQANVSFLPYNPIVLEDYKAEMRSSMTNHSNAMLRCVISDWAASRSQQWRCWCTTRCSISSCSWRESVQSVAFLQTAAGAAWKFEKHFRFFLE